jgi:hypothetical protein
MRLAVAASLAVLLLYALAAPRLGRRMPPGVAARVLALTSLVVAIGGVFVLGVLALTWVGQFSEVAELGSWSPAVLHQVTPIPATLAICSTAVLTAAAGSGALTSTRRIGALLSVHRTCRGLGQPGGLVVIDADRPEAFTTPDPRGRIVVTTGLLRALTPVERRVVLAHERSHLRHRHAWWVLAADLAAAVNPLLLPTARTVRHGVERWADEDAVEEVADRQLVARTLARTALLVRGTETTAVLAATSGDVPARVRALLAPPPRRHTLALVALVALLLAGVITTIAVQRDGQHLFEQAKAPHTEVLDS